MLTPQQTAELQRLKAYFPFRVVFGVIRKDGTFESYAKTTMHTANKLAREGHTVMVIQ
jgi:hypothetical protein